MKRFSFAFAVCMLAAVLVLSSKVTAERGAGASNPSREAPAFGMPVTAVPQPTLPPAPTAAPPTQAPVAPTAPPINCNRYPIQSPTLVGPPNGSAISSLPFDLKWSRPVCGFYFIFTVEREAPDRQRIFRFRKYEATKYTISDLAPGAYRWRVRACFNDNCGPYSAWWHFGIRRFILPPNL